MNKKNFAELLGSVRDAGRIARGEMKPSREYVVKDGLRFETKEDVQLVRHQFNASQSAFAKLLGVSINTLQNWEQGRRQPTGAARILLSIAFRQPKLFRETVETDYPEFSFA